MNKLKMKFSYVENNMGDMLNVMIPRDVFGVEIKHTQNPYVADSTGIGSYLNTYFVPKSAYKEFSTLKKIGMKAFDTFENETKIWSTGFISYAAEEEVCIRSSKIKIASVRGELSKQRLEKILNQKLDITTGDGGLLSSELIKSTTKKFEIGIIPHFKELDEKIYSEILSKYPSIKLIDLRKEPYSVLEEISECEYILSSSLHGLIVSDSLRIPNLRIITSNRLLGDGFKFDDYYSSFGIESNRVVVNKVEDFPTINNIIDSYKINDEMVDKKKSEIYDAFFKDMNFK
ncbi:MAG TPA: hypothetical protein DEQ26_15865 [Flavobacteriaceae bacterium]|nr:hypothetical protein [Flavobacteriaceae bacterium]